MTADNRAHWDQVYASKGDQEVSWFEESPQISLELLRAAGLTSEDAVIDIGGGVSRLVDALVAAGQARVAVLDVSANAIERARARLGSAAVEWIASDVTSWTPTHDYDFWHDRAAFHFLTEAGQQEAYLRVLRRALKPGGAAIIGTFAPDGPERCSGLPVARHDSASLHAILGPEFSLEDERRHDHVTPWGAVQHFQFSTFRRMA